ncbi:MAG: hypothetical protein MJ247_07475 [Alphaproteobacteria bacterium]|nr:hypothetical protein [Alphaproteobacteria bacterium]
MKDLGIEKTTTSYVSNANTISNAVAKGWSGKTNLEFISLVDGDKSVAKLRSYNGSVYTYKSSDPNAFDGFNEHDILTVDVEKKSLSKNIGIVNSVSLASNTASSEFTSWKNTKDYTTSGAVFTNSNDYNVDYKTFSDSELFYLDTGSKIYDDNNNSISLHNSLPYNNDLMNVRSYARATQTFTYSTNFLSDTDITNKDSSGNFTSGLYFGSRSSYTVGGVTKYRTSFVNSNGEPLKDTSGNILYIDSTGKSSLYGMQYVTLSADGKNIVSATTMENSDDPTNVKGTAYVWAHMKNEAKGDLDENSFDGYLFSKSCTYNSSECLYDVVAVDKNGNEKHIKTAKQPVTNSMFKFDRRSDGSQQHDISSYSFPLSYIGSSGSSSVVPAQANVGKITVGAKTYNIYTGSSSYSTPKLSGTTLYIPVGATVEDFEKGLQLIGLNTTFQDGKLSIAASTDGTLISASGEIVSAFGWSGNSTVDELTIRVGDTTSLKGNVQLKADTLVSQTSLKNATASAFEYEGFGKFVVNQWKSANEIIVSDGAGNSFSVKSLSGAFSGLQSALNVELNVGKVVGGNAQGYITAADVQNPVLVSNTTPAKGNVIKEGDLVLAKNSETSSGLIYQTLNNSEDKILLYSDEKQLIDGVYYKAKQDITISGEDVVWDNDNKINDYFEPYDQTLGLSSPKASIAIEMDAGTINVDGTDYIIHTEADENSMVQTYNAGAVFKIVASYNYGGVDTTMIVDENDVCYTLKGSVPNSLDGHIAGSNDSIELIDNLQIVFNEDGTFKILPSDDISTIAKLTQKDGKYKSEHVNTLAFTESKINVKKGATIEEFCKTLENFIGSEKISAKIDEDNNVVIKTRDNTSIKTTGPIADAFGWDVGSTIKLTDDMSALELAYLINQINGVNASFDNDGHFVIKSDNGEDLLITGSLAKKLGFNEQITNGSNNREDYSLQFENIIKQIDELVHNDTSYKGINLLNGDDLQVAFDENRTTAIDLKGVVFDSIGLGLTKTENKWRSNKDIVISIDQVRTAKSKVRVQSSKYAQQLSTLQIRESFTENLINILGEGANKLTLADMNEEGANMLALQTRQALSTKSLSLSTQSDKEIMQLFE